MEALWFSGMQSEQSTEVGVKDHIWLRFNKELHFLRGGKQKGECEEEGKEGEWKEGRQDGGGVRK